MEQLNPRSRSDEYGSRINRDHSRILVYAVPWASVLLGSFIPSILIATALPLIPPLGFIMLLAWRMLRPGLLPVWAGFPLGIFDDLFSGQPFGSAILLWSLAMIALEVIETRFPWRDFWLDWVTASGLLIVYIAAGALLSGASITLPMLVALGPQLLLSILTYPLLTRIASRLDRFRLMRIRTIA
ncbi:rod shape-determining protein MreD [Altererythrobacter sp. MF3-039]|uniref:rod shape-determining protein MreD n=1 Tax=Altererythrobacter sp. MF3-039 TaxID=3252901 RepID=UPI00390C6CE2